MEAATLPSDVLITALSSRLCDLQTARLDVESAQIHPPTASDGAERRAQVAGALLLALEVRLAEGGTDYVALELLTDIIRDSVPDIDHREVAFCARFLDTARSIRFQGEGESGSREVTKWSRLIRYQSRFDRAKLSEAGRLFLKVIRHRNDWLYEDKHIESLERALHSGLFEDVPKLLAEILLALRGFAEELTQIRESPSIREMAADYLLRRDHFTDMLGKCDESVKRSLDMLRSDALRARYEQWSALHADPIVTLASLRAGIKELHQATEGLARAWRALLAEIAQTNRRPIGVIDFHAAMAGLLDISPSTEAMEGLIAGACGWSPRARIASTGSFLGTLAPLEEAPSRAPLVYEDDPSQVEQDGEDDIASWLQQNAEAVIAALQRGPIRLSDLMAGMGDFPIALSSLDDLSHALGMYAVEEPFVGRVFVEVLVTPEDAGAVIENRRVTTRDMVLAKCDAVPAPVEEDG